MARRVLDPLEPYHGYLKRCELKQLEPHSNFYTSEVCARLNCAVCGALHKSHRDPMQRQTEWYANTTVPDAVDHVLEV